MLNFNKGCSAFRDEGSIQKVDGTHMYSGGVPSHVKKDNYIT